jgi:hypothetical protein
MLNVPVDAVENRMPRGILSGMAALALGLTAGPASAQIAPGYSGTSDGGTVYMGSEEVWQALRVFGSCYARLSTPQALQLLANEPGTQGERDAVRLAIRDPQNCFGYVSRVRAPYSFLRGAVAEGLWKRRIDIPAALRRAAPVRGADSRNIHESARCVAAAHGDQVRALLATPLGSRRERDATAAFVSGPFRQCAPPEAGAFTLAPIMVRYLLAEALLRLPSPYTVPAGQR